MERTFQRTGVKEGAKTNSNSPKQHKASKAQQRQSQAILQQKRNPIDPVAQKFHKQVNEGEAELQQYKLAMDADGMPVQKKNSPLDPVAEKFHAQLKRHHKNTEPQQYKIAETGENSLDSVAVQFYKTVNASTETETQTGQELINHEQAHVKQQREGRVKPRKVQGKGMERVQAKLKMGNPNDTFEREADKMADNFSNKQPASQVKGLSPQQAQKKNEDDPKAGQGVLDERLAAAISGTMVGGQLLSEASRMEMEQHFQADLSAVRIHTGSDAIRLCNAIGAKAFTYLNHIFFNEKMYAPTTAEGKKLLVHELTHTIQQRAVIQRKIVQHHTSSPMVQLFPGEGKIDSWAENVPGYKLIKVILGKSPITGDAVERTPENFIGGFMALLPGGNQLFNKLKESGAIADTMTWLQQQVSELGITWAYVKGLVGRIWDQISIWNGMSTNAQIIRDILTPPYTRIKNFVVNIATKVKEFVLRGALKLAGAPVEIVMGILNKGQEIFAKILEDPIGFIKNLFTGVGKGLNSFIAKIGGYLSGGLKDWLLGKLSENGISVPATWDLKGIFGLVTQVVGVTYQKIRAKVVEKLGPKGEAMVEKMERAVAFVKDLITKGPIALWEKVQDSLGDIKDTIIGGIKSFIQEKVIKEGITFLLGMLNPAGALVKAVQLLVRLVNFLRENMARMASFVQSIFNSVVDIANGNLEGAAKAVEGALAKAIPIVISFAARLLGLGNLAKKVQEIIEKIGARVRSAVDNVITWLVEKAKALFNTVAGGLGFGAEEDAAPDYNDPEKEEKVNAGLSDIDKEEEKYLIEGKIEKEKAELVASVVKDRHKVFKSIAVVDGGETWDYDYTASPKKTKKGEKKKQRNLSQLRSWKKARVKLIPNGEISISPEQEEVYNILQENIFNQLNRKHSKYGDGSVAIIIILEKIRGEAVVGTTMHYIKGTEFITAITSKLSEHGKNVHPEAKNKLLEEITKIESAQNWSDGISLPKWARSSKNYQAIEDERINLLS